MGCCRSLSVCKSCVGMGGVTVGSRIIFLKISNRSMFWRAIALSANGSVVISAGWCSGRSMSCVALPATAEGAEVRLVFKQPLSR